MAKLLTWREEWTLRIDTLDEDHREIVDRLLDLARRFGEGPAWSAGPEEDRDDQAQEDLYAALGRFSAFARQHFQREEAFIRTIDYPGLAEHLSEHALLLAELTDLVRGLRAQGATSLGARDLEMLKQWVVAHILGADRKFADYYFQICR